MCYVLIFCTIKSSVPLLYINHDIQYILFISSIYMINVPEYKLLLTNILYNLLIFSFPKQYYTAKLTYVIK